MRGLLLLLALVLVGCGAAPASGAPTPSPPWTPALHTIQGTLNFRQAGRYQNILCRGEGGNDDIYYAQRVVMRDAHGDIVGVGTLSSGVPTSSNECVFTFTVKDVPESTFYTVGIAARPGPTYRLEDLQATGWRLSLQIGGGG